MELEGRNLASLTHPQKERGQLLGMGAGAWAGKEVWARPGEVLSSG